MIYQMPGMNEFVEGLILDRRANSFTIKRLSDGHVFNTHAGDIDIRETMQERMELDERLSEQREEFDIKKYKFSDSEIEHAEVIDGTLTLVIEAGHNCIEVSEQDAIAIAKHFKLI